MILIHPLRAQWPGARGFLKKPSNVKLGFGSALRHDVTSLMRRYRVAAEQPAGRLASRSAIEGR